MMTISVSLTNKTKVTRTNVSALAELSTSALLGKTIQPANMTLDAQTKNQSAGSEIDTTD